MPLEVSSKNNFTGLNEKGILIRFFGPGSGTELFYFIKRKAGR
ncbi:hypothetical protein HDC90_000787 [Pedobacter sp. AK013]|nr:hypothetical protein [Pedobacter sp. AK013]